MYWKLRPHIKGLNLQGWSNQCVNLKTFFHNSRALVWLHKEKYCMKYSRLHSTTPLLTSWQHFLFSNSTFHPEVLVSCCCTRSQLPPIPHLRCVPKRCLVGSQKYCLCSVFFADYCYLQSGSETQREEETESGSRYPWISRVKKKKKGGCLLQEITRQDKGGLFSSILFLNSLIHAATPPPFWFIQGDSISILVPSFALPINSFLPCVGP